MTEPAFTNKEKADCARREVSHRKWVYERLVANGEKPKHVADREIAMMQEIEREYRAKAQADEPDLFGR